MSDADAYTQRIVEEVLAFLRAGGQVTWTEWRKMNVDYRGAFIAATQRIEIERELRGRASTADLYAEIDGGELHDTLGLIDAVERLAG